MTMPCGSSNHPGARERPGRHRNAGRRDPTGPDERQEGTGGTELDDLAAGDVGDVEVSGRLVHRRSPGAHEAFGPPAEGRAELLEAGQALPVRSKLVDAPAGVVDDHHRLRAPPSAARRSVMPVGRSKPPAAVVVLNGASCVNAAGAEAEAPPPARPG